MKQAKQDDKLTLAVAGREVYGKKLKKLRKSGEIPGNIYGPDFKSKAITVSYKDFSSIYRKARETGIVYLNLDKSEVPVLIKNLQKHPVEDQILHIDFRKIDLTKKIETEVPIKVTGVSEAVAVGGGVLLTQKDHLLIEALPKDIPQAIEIDISTLKEIGQDIKVADLAKSAAFTIKTDPESVIVSVTAHKEESLTPETAPAEAPEVLTAKEGEEALAEGTEPAPAAEAATGKEEGKKEQPAAKAPEGKEKAESSKKE